jgi:hypothetical protein
VLSEVIRSAKIVAAKNAEAIFPYHQLFGPVAVRLDSNSRVLRDSASKQCILNCYSKLHIFSDPSYDVSSTLDPKAIQPVASK